MTRYARGKGSKGCNNKQENTSTSWNLLKGKLRSSIESGKSKVKSGYKEEGSKQIQDNVLRSETSGNEQWFDFCGNRKQVKCDKLSKLKSGIGFHSGNRRNDIHTRSIKTGVSQAPEEIGVRWRKTAAVTGNDIYVTECNEKSSSKFERKLVPPLDKRRYKTGNKVKIDLSEDDRRLIRRKEKALKREKKKVCFCCRRWGHQLAECPEFKPIESSDACPPAGGLCYHCGSTEHNVNQCRKPGANALKYARCFVCGEDGHLARQCQENPNGKYPKGGSCRFCGETSHLCSECPKGANKTAESQDVLSCTSEAPVDSLPGDMRKNCQEIVSTKKIIQF